MRSSRRRRGDRSEGFDLHQAIDQAIAHPEDLATDLDHRRRMLAGELPTYTMEKRYIRKDGEPIWSSSPALLHPAPDRPAHICR